MAKTTITWSGDQSTIVYDATAAYTVSFTYNGNQVRKNYVVIKNNATNVVVFEDTLVSMRLDHTIPQNALTNGETYNIGVQVYYQNDAGVLVADAMSDPVLINCLATPIVTISNIISGQIIRNSNVDLSIRYSQEQNSLPNRYVVKLFDNGRTEIWNSGNRYSTASTVPATINATISNLLNKQKYYVSCDIDAVGGITGTTGLIGFLTEYQSPRSYSTMYLENIEDQCSIKATSNIKAIDAIIEGASPGYIEGDLIDLSSGNTTVRWEAMGDVGTDMQLMLKIRAGSEAYKEIAVIESENRSLKVKVLKGKLYGQTVEKLYAVLYAPIGSIIYTTNSNLIDVPMMGEEYTVSLVREGTYYSLSVWKEAPKV